MGYLIALLKHSLAFHSNTQGGFYMATNKQVIIGGFMAMEAEVNPVYAVLFSL